MPVCIEDWETVRKSNRNTTWSAKHPRCLGTPTGRHGQAQEDGSVRWGRTTLPEITLLTVETGKRDTLVAASRVGELAADGREYTLDLVTQGDQN